MMKLVWLVVSVLCGAWGLLGAFRAFERYSSSAGAAHDAGFLTGQLAFAALMLLIAWKAWGKVRA